MNRTSISRIILLLGLFIVVAFLGGCAPAVEETPEATAEETETPAAETSSDVPTPPVAFGVVPVPADNPNTPEKVALGRQLYFDSRLSADGSRSCYSCHVCENGLTDGKPVAEGALGKMLTRSSPSLWNVAYHTEFYWDGRSPSLEKQALAAWTGANMGAKADEIVAKLNQIEGYRTQFQTVFSADVTPDNVVQAISAFERTYLFCSDTPYDRWQAGDASAVSDAAKRGAELFVAKAGCGTCHSGSLFTDLKYHNTGIGMDRPEPDLGRFNVTKVDADKGAFKTPSLRDISKSAPYFHDGSVATLKEAVDLMASGGIDNPNLDRENLKNVNLTEEEKADVIEFLKALDCPCGLEAPTLPQ
ncbi:MAG: cytochrome-c peroxidase [Vicinamibacteria bacterium]